MRKRLVIAAIAVVIGVAAYMFSPPKEGTVEWHKKQYWASRYPKVPLLEQIRFLPIRLSGRSLTGCFPPTRYPGDTEVDSHLRALEEVGFLRRRGLELIKNDYGTFYAGQSLSAKAEKALAKHIWAIGITNDGEYLLYEARDAARWETLISEVHAENR